MSAIKMKDQEIFEILSEAECETGYAYWADSKNDDLKKAHEFAKQALIAFSKATGCRNQ